jgi:hypothetical protein
MNPCSGLGPILMEPDQFGEPLSLQPLPGPENQQRWPAGRPDQSHSKTLCPPQRDSKTLGLSSPLGLPLVKKKKKLS